MFEKYNYIEMWPAMLIMTTDPEIAENPKYINEYRVSNLDTWVRSLGMKEVIPSDLHGLGISNNPVAILPLLKVQLYDTIRMQRMSNCIIIETTLDGKLKTFVYKGDYLAEPED